MGGLLHESHSVLAIRKKTQNTGTLKMVTFSILYDFSKSYSSLGFGQIISIFDMRVLGVVLYRNRIRF